MKPLLAALSVFTVGGALAVVHAQSAAGPARASVPNLDAVSIHVLPVQRNVYMLVGAGSNIAVQAGDDGVLMVDAEYEALAPKIAAAVRTLSPRPLHTLISSHADPDHTGGIGALVKLLGGGPQAVRVMAQENVLTRMQAAGTKTTFALNAVISLPITSTYFTPSRDFFLNGEAVILYHAPAAHTDGDTLVYFRGSDVLTTGDTFTPDVYPVIDVRNGGTVNGEIAALNRILEIAVPGRYQEGGTYIVPGHGRLCDEADVVEYRDMVTIVRDRVQDLIARRMTLEQVKAARPSRDYDTEYASASGPSGDMFVESVYRSLSNASR